MNKKNRVLVIAAWIIVFVPLLYISTCSVRSHTKNMAFEKVSVGNTKQQVMGLMGTPSVRESSAGPVFLRYASSACKSPCVERFWYENQMSMVGEAWSVEFDANARVVDKAYWVFP